MKKLFLITALLFAATANSYAYDGRATYSADQMFDNSLQELRDAMAKAKESNDELKSENRVLKQEVANLENAVSDSGTEQVVEESSDEAAVENPLSDEAIADQEKRLYQSRLENLSLRLSRLGGQKKRLEKNVNLYAQENEKTRQQIAALKKDVSDIQLALSSPEKSQVVKSDKKSAPLLKQLAAKKDQIAILEKKLAFQKASMKDELALKEKYASENAALEELVASGRAELARVEGGRQLLGRSQKSLNLSAENEAIARREVGDLENYRNHLRESVNDLKKASAAVKPSQTADLEKILKTYKEQQALLQKKMELMRPGSSLLVRKESLMAEKSRLENQIAQAEKLAGASDVSKAGDSGDKSELSASLARVRDLKKKIADMRNASPLQKQYQNLSGELAVLQQDLQNLRDNPQGEFAKDPKEVKNEIAQLEARRIVLASSVQNIYEKYNMKELSAEDLAAKEAELKEYFETLRVENSALQEKLLTLQMRQDKSAPTVQ
jgi:chromosome segregation ATPase